MSLTIKDKYEQKGYEDNGENGQIKWMKVITNTVDFWTEIISCNLFFVALKPFNDDLWYNPHTNVKYEWEKGKE